MSRRSACQTMYYCSAACQLVDWRAGGHKTKCASLRTSCEQSFFSSYPILMKIADHADPFSSRKLSFMRFILHDDYLAHRCEVFCRQIGFMKQNPGGDFYTLFWYTEGKVDIDVHAIGEYPETYDWGVDWEYYRRRKAQSKGRMDLHLMVISQLGGTEARMFPKRSRDDSVAIGQREIAERPYRVAEDEAEEIERLVLALRDKDEGCIH
ncbi:hypothetical protein MVEN_00156500 [Mycena venus]|uniref:MYND-type domain-containing protein n=1 Tax=Mycena venus TaxID=2733690 RepID=A0A8H7DAJ1_9AGAR|nr:hypothetical protein MVEN_00156500 [Mycena venus]